MASFSNNVIFIEKFETRKLNRFVVYVVNVCFYFVFRWSPSIHVHHNLYFGDGLNVLEICHHPLRKSMDNKNFWREMVVAYNLSNMIDDKIYICRIHGADNR